MTENKKTWISHSGLDVLYRCPRCFWLKYKMEINQPEGIVSRLADRFDKVLKNYFDIFRPLGELPPMIQGKIEGKLENPFRETYFYSIDEKYGFLAKLDECVVNEKGERVPVDFKTSSSDPRNRIEVFPAYQHQMDEFAFLMEQNHWKTAGFGYLVYVYPAESDRLHDGFPMVVHMVKLETHPETVLARLREGVNVLEGAISQPSRDCPFCQWRENLNGVLADKN